MATVSRRRQVPVGPVFQRIIAAQFSRLRNVFFPGEGSGSSWESRGMLG
jgi:hypothetical protein